MKLHTSEILPIILSIHEAITYLKLTDISQNDKLLDDVLESVGALSIYAQDQKIVETLISELQKAKLKNGFSEDFDVVYATWSLGIIDKTTDKKTSEAIYSHGIDDDFKKICESLATNSVNDLLKIACENVQDYGNEDTEYLNSLSLIYKQWYGVQSLELSDKTFVEYFGSVYQFLKGNVHKLSCFYDELSDNRSKLSLTTILRHWLTFKPNLTKTGIESTYPQYFDLDVMKCGPEEVFVDCGAYIGDTIESYIEIYGERYKSIYAYEMTPESFSKLKRNCKKYKNIRFRNKGVGNRNTLLPYLDIPGIPAGNRFGDGGNRMASIISLDEDIKEKVTFIKMDIEGSEAAALQGARKIIQKYHPKLAICLYHKIEDIIDLPNIVKEIDPTYRFYLRNAGGLPLPTEYYMLCI